MTQIDTGTEIRKVSERTPGLSSKRMAFREIPVVDFSAMRTNDEAAKHKLAADIHRACTEVGFFYIDHHGFPTEVTDQLFAASKRFFALDSNKKMEIDISRSSFNRGYIPLYGEKNNAKSKGDLKETFDMSVDIPEDDPDYQTGNPLYGPNQWPSEPQEFKATLNRYYAHITALSEKLYRAFALALDLPEHYFLGMLGKPLDILRLLHYPPQPVVDDHDTIGTGAHSDFDCFTVLTQDPVGGLQALNSAGEWVDAPFIEDTFLINVGDMLERWTNGSFVSTVHRVINRSEHERYSVVFFAAPNYHTKVECLPSCSSEDNPPKFPPVSAGEYIISRYNEVLV